METQNDENQLRKKIMDVINEIDQGFKTVMILYKIAFYFGILIIVFGLVGVIVFDEKTIFASLTAGGIADFLAFIIFKPMDGIQKSRILISPSDRWISYMV